jgi:uncharacterized protein YhaN
MRIDRIRVDAFGRLAGLDTGVDPLPGLVVALGPNEAGKSTLFAFLTTMFYGFQPATREGNPHTPWGLGEASGRIRLRLGDGIGAEVERKLRSQPATRLSLGGTTRELRNQPLPWVEHVPRAVFRQVFAVTLKELAGLDPETWGRIQDKVVGSMGATDLRSARAVADALDAEAGEIWRPNRRGHQKLRAVQGDARALRARRAAAVERDARLRAVGKERESLDERFVAVRGERHQLRAAVDRMQTLIPLERQIDRIESLRAEGGERELLRGLPDDPLQKLAALEAERSTSCARLGKLEAELADQDRAIGELGERARTILERRTEIAHLVARSVACGPDRARARDLERSIVEVEARLDVAAQPLLAGGWRDQHDAVARLPIAVLEDRIARARAAPPQEVGGRGAMLALALGALAGIALLLWGTEGGQPVPIALGAAITAAAVAAAVTKGRDPRPRETARSPTLDATSLSSGLRLQPARRGQLDAALVSELARVQSLLGERNALVQALADARARVQEVDASAESLARELGLTQLTKPTGAEAIAATLHADLVAAERTREAADHAARESKRLVREHDDVSARLSQLATSIAALEQAGRTFSPTDVRRGLDTARVRIAAHVRADRLEEELERAHPDLHALVAQIRATSRGEHARRDGADLATSLQPMKDRLESLEEEAELLVRRIESLDAEARQLRASETVDAVDGEVAALKETEERLARDRDRKFVLARILREADRRFREEHQPELLRRAGSYLSHLTGGRYERLVVDETDGASPFRLVGPGLPAPVPLAAPVSTGTLEQAYLSLRLAIIDHLDRGGERLPLFVDEIFVNWDAERRARGVELLSSIASSRQIFVFTCHPPVAEELAGLGGRVLAL